MAPAVLVCLAMCSLLACAAVPKGMHGDATKVGLQGFGTPSKGVHFGKAVPADTPSTPAYCFPTMSEIRKVVRDAKALGATPQWPKGTALTLEGCQLARLPDELGELANLEEIDISNNRLSALPESMASMPRLARLRSWGNDFTEFPPVLRRIRSLDTLEILHSPGIREVPVWIGSLRNLKVLNLFHNRLSSLPDSLGSLAHLEVLNLHNNSFANVPDAVCKLSSLQELDLSVNQLTVLPDCLGHIPFLVWMPFWSNHVQRIPDSFGRLGHMRGLLASHNDLQSVPEVLASWVQATIFDVSSNRRLDQVPNFLTRWPELETLRVWNSSVNHVPAWIGELSKLKDIDFSQTSIAELPLSLRKLGALERAMFGSTQLAALPDGLFDGLKKLQRLDLADTPLVREARLPKAWCADRRHPLHALVRDVCQASKQARQAEL